MSVTNSGQAWADPDITVTRNGELMVAGIQGENYDGCEFVDAWMPLGEMTVVDAGQIIVPEESVAAFIELARLDGFIVAEEQQGPGEHNTTVFPIIGGKWAWTCSCGHGDTYDTSSEAADGARLHRSEKGKA